MDEKLKLQLQEAASDGKISCAVARALAERLGVDYASVGRAADELKIRIFGCDLGCF